MIYTKGMMLRDLVESLNRKCTASNQTVLHGKVHARAMLGYYNVQLYHRGLTTNPSQYNPVYWETGWFDKLVKNNGRLHFDSTGITMSRDVLWSKGVLSDSDYTTMTYWAEAARWYEISLEYNKMWKERGTQKVRLPLQLTPQGVKSKLGVRGVAMADIQYGLGMLSHKSFAPIMRRILLEGEGIDPNEAGHLYEGFSVELEEEHFFEIVSGKYPATTPLMARLGGGTDLLTHIYSRVPYKEFLMELSTEGNILYVDDRGVYIENQTPYCEAIYGDHILIHEDTFVPSESNLYKGISGEYVTHVQALKMGVEVGKFCPVTMVDTRGKVIYTYPNDEVLPEEPSEFYIMGYKLDPVDLTKHILVQGITFASCLKISKDICQVGLDYAVYDQWLTYRERHASIERAFQ